MEQFGFFFPPNGMKLCQHRNYTPEADTSIIIIIIICVLCSPWQIAQYL